MLFATFGRKQQTQQLINPSLDILRLQWIQLQTSGVGWKEIVLRDMALGLWMDQLITVTGFMRSVLTLAGELQLVFLLLTPLLAVELELPEPNSGFNKIPKKKGAEAPFQIILQHLYQVPFVIACNFEHQLL